MTSWTGDELEALGERLLASRHITRLSSGPAGTVAAYLPGRRIPGLRITEGDRVEVHVVIPTTSTVAEVEADVAAAFDRQEALAALFIDDVDDDDGAAAPSREPTSREVGQSDAATR
jgi:hypothetical protein